jgi:hypothetical protein
MLQPLDYVVIVLYQGLVTAFGLKAGGRFCEADRSIHRFETRISKGFGL